MGKSGFVFCSKAALGGAFLLQCVCSLLFLSLTPLRAEGWEGGDVLSAFSAKASDSLVSFHYAYTMPRGGTLIKGSGDIRLQGEKYIMEGDGLEVYCDGVSRWTLDRQSEEMIIESVLSGDHLSNPASLLGKVDLLFPGRKLTTGQFHGRKAAVATLTPAPGSSSVTELKVYFDGETPCGMVLTLSDGSMTTIEISSLRFLPKLPEDEFSFDEKTLGGGWISTDLRQ